MSKVRTAVIGAGRLGGFHAQKLAAMDQVDLVAVVDPVAAQRNRVAAECRTQAVADYRSLLGAVDAVVVAAPTLLHHQIGMEFLARGVHVLMEKPLAATLAEADDLVKAARAQRAILQVGHVERFNPALSAALPHIDSPKYIEAVRASGYTFRSTDIGVVLDLMIHDLDLVLSMVHSDVERVQALGLSVLGGHEDVAHARLEFECGCVATFSASRVSHDASRQMQVWSPKSYASLDFANRKTTLVVPSETLLRRQFDVDSLSPQEVDHYRQHLLEEHLPRQVIESPPVDALALEASDFIESVRTGRSPRVTGEQGRRAVAVAEQILDRIHSHAWDDAPDGPVGPLATPRPSVIPAPHWHLAPSDTRIVRKEAG
ncbi:MAG: Gfo/Idh/MocA family oxidoreductase, partial [Pirellulales bacterium]|nr:Gfo/Idh/MocA family oxidoreductase [Pirellulales bacterium]